MFIFEKKQIMIIAFVTQKGGAGKTTSTMLVSTCINHYSDFKIAVIDVDIQSSFTKKRESELKKIKDLEEEGKLLPQTNYYKYLKNLEDNDRKLYDVINLDIKDQNLTEKILEYEKQYDAILIDLPGTLDIDGVAKILSIIDIVFLPIFAEEMNFISAFDFILILDQIKNEPKTRLKAFYPYFFRYSPHKRKDVWKSLEDVFNEHKIEYLKEPIFESQDIEQNVSTIIPLKHNVLEFTTEVLNYIELNKK